MNTNKEIKTLPNNALDARLAIALSVASAGRYVRLERSKQIYPIE
jgi:hypothetical protein